MHLVPLDWFIVVLSIGISFLPALLLMRRAGRSTAEFFTSGRSAHWWLIGVSMVATTFSRPALGDCAEGAQAATSRPSAVTKMRWRLMTETQYQVADAAVNGQRDVTRSSARQVAQRP